jgi:hypothetical protein
MKKTIHLALTSMLVFSVLYLSAGATPPPPPNGSGSAPIDNGALVLLVVVAIYGYRRLKQKDQMAEE